MLRRILTWQPLHTPARSQSVEGNSTDTNLTVNIVSIGADGDPDSMLALSDDALERLIVESSLALAKDRGKSRVASRNSDLGDDREVEVTSVNWSLASITSRMSEFTLARSSLSAPEDFVSTSTGARFSSSTDFSAELGLAPRSSTSRGSGSLRVQINPLQANAQRKSLVASKP